MEFATIADIQSGWKVLTSTEQARATALASRASAMITARAERRGKNPEEFTASELAVCKAAVCDAVRYSLAPSFMEGEYGEAPGEMEGGTLMLPERILDCIGLGRGRARFAGAIRD